MFNEILTKRPGVTDLQHATYHNDVAGVRAALARGERDELEIIGNNSLMSAAERGFVECLDLMINAGMDVNKPNQHGFTALMNAAFYGQTKCVKRLLDASVDIDAISPHTYRTALHVAADHSDRHETIQLLVGAGADVNYKTPHGLNTLMRVAHKGNIQSLKLLLPIVDNINQKDGSGHTAVIWASLAGHFNCVKALIEAGADVNINFRRGNEFDTALMGAFVNGNSSIVKHLLEAGASPPNLECALMAVKKGIKNFDQGTVLGECLAILVESAGINPVLVKRRIKNWKNEAAQTARAMLEAQILADLSKAIAPRIMEVRHV